MTETLAPLSRLRDRLSRLRAYPPQMEPTVELIPGRAFFPGGDGLWKSQDPALPHWPEGGVMILGQDFDCVASYKRAVERGYEQTNTGTWYHLIRMLQSADMPPDNCFFTNFFMGVRRTEKATGLCPGVRDSGFVKECGEFFGEQLRVQRPRLIIVLGTNVPRFLARTNPASEVSRWARCDTFPKIDAAGPLIAQARFGSPDSAVVATVAVVVHPSLRPANLWRRQYTGLRGEKAEQQLLKNALRASGLAALGKRPEG